MARMVTSSCDVCGFPMFAAKDHEGPLICWTCKMIALDECYANGSTPAMRLPDAKVEQIKERYFALTL